MQVRALFTILATAIPIGACGGNSGDDDDNSVDAMNVAIDASDFEDCESLTEGAVNTYQPADIIFVIDNTPSMEDEIEAVRANMNGFSSEIMASGIDVQITMISCLPGDCGNSGGGAEFFGICIESPLGADDGCEGDPAEGPVTDDTNLPHYKHLSTRVPSMKGLRWVVETYNDDNDHTAEGWSDMIRTDSVKHVVLVSDDADEWTASEFDSAFQALDPVLLADYKFHGIFAYMSKDEACDISEEEPCCEFAAPAVDPELHWDSYATLVTMTGGTSGDLCLQDFEPVFEALGTSVIASSEIACEWVIPEPPEGETFDSDFLNIEFVNSEGESSFIGHVDSADDCGSAPHAWYYDELDPPTMIYVCPQTCDWFQSEEGAHLIIHFGCETEEVEVE